MSRSYLRFWGVRGSYPAPFADRMRVGGNTPCVELRVGDRVIVLDAGTGLIPLGGRLADEPGTREISVLLSHHHWDHISGLPFFAPAFLPGRRIDFYGPAGDADELAFHIAQQMKAPYFPVETETWLADIGYHVPPVAFAVGPVRVRRFTMHHPGLTYAYRIEVDGKTVVYAPDNELAFINHAIDDRQAEFDEEERRLLAQMKEEQRWRSIEFMDGADVLIHDAQYTSEDYRRKRGWGHSCYIDTVNSAVDAGVGDLRLFSHDPSYDDDRMDELERHAVNLVEERQSAMPCSIAREGMVIPLD